MRTANRYYQPKPNSKLPVCYRCGRTRVLSPCRDCATPEEASRYPALPETKETRTDALDSSR